MKYMDCFLKITDNVLASLYQTAGASLVMAALFMFAYLNIVKKGWRQTIEDWWLTFRTSRSFRRVFCLAFYTSMILFRTLFNRGLWFNSLNNLLGTWGLYDKNGVFTTEVIENLLLFIPFTILYLWVFREKLLEKQMGFFKTVWRATRLTFLVSFVIEFLQLFLRVGTFQLSDLFYNTLGGFIGGLIYWIAYKIAHRKNKKKNIKENQGN